MPALPDHPDPFESQSADSGVMVFAFGALAGVISAGPEGLLDRLGGELMESLAKELGTEVTPTDAELFTAALNDRWTRAAGACFVTNLVWRRVL